MSVQSKLTAIANAIRAKTGGSANLNLDQMATEIAGLSKPTGTLSITANGTYDVTDKASASVNVQSGATNLKQIYFTLENDTSGTYNILTADADVMAHYADDTATAILECLDSPASTNSVRWVYASNTELYSSYYQVRVQRSSSWGAAYSAYPLKSANANYNLCAKSDGNLCITLTTSRLLAAGNYRCTFMW